MCNHHIIRALCGIIIFMIVGVASGSGVSERCYDPKHWTTLSSPKVYSCDSKCDGIFTCQMGVAPTCQTTQTQLNIPSPVCVSPSFTPTAKQCATQYQNIMMNKDPLC